MKGNQIKCAIVARMWSDGLTVSRKPADLDTVARYAVPPNHRQAAVEEIRDYMLPDEDCPVVQVSADVTALQPNPQKVMAYLRRY